MPGCDVHSFMRAYTALQGCPLARHVGWADATWAACHVRASRFTSLSSCCRMKMVRANTCQETGGVAGLNAVQQARQTCQHTVAVVQRPHVRLQPAASLAPLSHPRTCRS